MYNVGSPWLSSWEMKLTAHHTTANRTLVACFQLHRAYFCPLVVTLSEARLGEYYKSLDHASSVCILTHWHTPTQTHTRDPLIQPQDKSIPPLMDSLLLNGPILHCLLWVTRCVFKIHRDLRSMALYRHTSQVQRWSVFMCTSTISTALTKKSLIVAAVRCCVHCKSGRLENCGI